MTRDTRNPTSDLSYADTLWKAAERNSPNLKRKLPRDYARRGINPVKMAALINLIAEIGFKGNRDTLGRDLRVLGGGTDSERLRQSSRGVISLPPGPVGTLHLQATLRCGGGKWYR